MSVILEAIHLCKVYEKGSSKVEVLQDVSFSLQKNNPVVIEGASGAGKSTLLHLLGGLDQPSSGTVKFEGKDLFKKSEKELAKFRNHSLGFVFQFHHLLPLFSALENIMMPSLIAGEEKALSQEKAWNLLKQVGLEKRASHKPTELSGGEQQRVAIARALIMRPSLLMADEPTGNLDGENSRKIFELLLELTEHYQSTLILVTHNEELATKLKFRIRIQDGKIVQ